MPTSKIVPLLLLLSISCAAPRRAPVATASPVSPASLTVAPPEPPAYRGRVTTTVDALTSAWTDVIVAGTTDEHQRACVATLRGQQWQNEAASHLPSQVHSCGLEPLPPPPGSAAYVLVDPGDPAEVSGARLFANVNAGYTPPPETIDAAITVTHYWRFASEAACEKARAQHLARREQTAAEVDASARKFLAAELATQEKNRDAACHQLHERDARCAALRAAPPPNVRRACKGHPDSDRCAAARDQALDLESCGLRNVGLTCENAEALVKTLREHVPKPSQPPTVPPLFCRPG